MTGVDQTNTGGAAGAVLRDADWPAKVDGLLARQRSILGTLDALSQRQAGLVEARDTERLLGLLAERGRLADDLSAASRSFEPYRAAWETLLESVDDARAAGWRGELSGIMKTAAEIASRDAVDAGAIRRVQEELAAKLSGVGRGTAAAKAYAGPRAGGARFQDREA